MSPAPKKRTNDRLIRLPEVVELTTMSEATIRWKRHHGEMEFIFRLGRRLVAWESDLLAWIDAQAVLDKAESEVKPGNEGDAITRIDEAIRILQDTRALLVRRSKDGPK